jgi:MYXO-CTERM domain-containing protein
MPPRLHVPFGDSSLPPRSPQAPSFSNAPPPRRSGRALAAAFALTAAFHLASAPDARAYCRTTTVPVEAGYNPVATGMCMMAGKPIAWPQATRVGYELDQSASVQVDLTSFTTAADRAFDAWNTVACPFGDGGSANPNITAFDDGTVDAALVAVDCGFVQCGPTVHDSHHVITFRDKEFVSNDPTSTIALTIVTYGVTSGTIFDADMEINTAQYSISVVRPTPSGSYDLQSIITHEAGHFLGLAHSQVDGAAMDAFYPPGRPITLTADDDDGICAIYPPPAAGTPGPSAVGGCAVASVAGSRGGFIAGGALLLALAGVLRRRRRERCGR